MTALEAYFWGQLAGFGYFAGGLYVGYMIWTDKR